MAARCAVHERPAGASGDQPDAGRGRDRAVGGRRDQRTTVKDMLDYVPGVWAQPKWGEDSRLSIRGSGLSRNFHGRALAALHGRHSDQHRRRLFRFAGDRSDRLSLCRGLRAPTRCRYGANSLGGAINFVTPSGRNASPFAARADVGSFGYRRLQASSGGAVGPFDYFVTGSWQEQDGFREHSNGTLIRGFANFGYQITPNIETRFYFNGNNIEQRIPGTVTKYVRAERAADAGRRQRRSTTGSATSIRTASPTRPRSSFDDTTVEVGAFNVDRHLMHPIFQWLDYTYDDYGGFGRVVDDRTIGGFRNRLVAGVNILNGDDRQQAIRQSAAATKGKLLSSSNDRSKNTSVLCREFVLLPAECGGGRRHAVSERQPRTHRPVPVERQSVGRNQFQSLESEIRLAVGSRSDRRRSSPTSRAAPRCRASARASRRSVRRAEPPNIPFTADPGAARHDLRNRHARQAAGLSPGTSRSTAPRSRNELQCLYSVFGNCNVTNADRTIHQGVEIGIGAAILKSMFVHGANPDKLWLQLAYTYNDFFFDNDPMFGNNQLPGAPPQYSRAELLYKHPTGWFFGPNIEWVPQGYFVDSANTLTIDPYVLWGMKAGFDNGGTISPMSRAEISPQAYIASASIINVATANPLVRTGSGARCMPA